MIDRYLVIDRDWDQDFDSDMIRTVEICKTLEKAKEKAVFFDKVILKPEVIQ
jgi:hypothetical protein